MVFVDTPLTASIREAVNERWGVTVDCDGERLYGGEESASYRAGDRVIRIGPTWRTTEELEWAYAIAARTAGDVPEVTAPYPTRDETFLVRVDGRPVSLWPFVAGSWADDNDDHHRRQASDLLARLHRVFASLHVPPRPSGGGLRMETASEVADPQLDRWLAEFEQRHQVRQPLHGDFYAGNVLVRDGRIRALVDWDDVFCGPPEQELAWAAWEWGAGLPTLDLTAATRFIDWYVADGGTASRIDEEQLAQLIRGRIRMEVNYSQAVGQWGVSSSPDDIEYEARQLEAFQTLRP